MRGRSDVEVRVLDGELPPGEPEAGFGALETAIGPLPLEALGVEASLVGLGSRVRVSQRFRNPRADPLEATYVFPLPPEAAVSRLVFRLGERVVEGEIQERGAARDVYDEAIASGRAAAIAEEERPDVFTLRVGNVAAGEVVEVELELVGLLPVADGEVSFRFPLVVAPRYVPGEPLDGPPVGEGVEADTDAAPDASRVSPPVLLPGLRAGVELSMVIRIDDPEAEIEDLRASLHGVRLSRQGRWLQVELVPDGTIDRDFVLRYRLARSAEDAPIAAGLRLAPDADGEGTWLLSLARLGEGRSQRRARDVAFLLDRSGSMGGWKMVTARRATAAMISTLGGDDRFAVYAFDDELAVLDLGGDDGLIAATERLRERASRLVEELESRGGTEMAHPLDRALTQLTRSPGDRERLLILITDGQVANEDELLRLAGDRLERVRVLCVGIDQAVNAGLLGRLSSRSGGMTELVEREEQLEGALRRIHRHAAAPLLTDITLTFDGLTEEEGSRAPSAQVDLFETAPLLLTGRYRRDRPDSTPRVTITARGTEGDQRRLVLDGDEVDAPELRRIWARLKVRDLEDRYAVTPSVELERQIIDLSTSTGVLCRFTAWVAVDEAGERRAAAGGPRSVIQPVEAPSGWGMWDAGVGAAGRVSQTRAGVLKGKLGHMPPEQVRGQRMSWRSDVYSLAVVLWELIEGRRLFDGASDFEILQACVEAKLPRPLLSRQEVAPLEPLLTSMLAPHPDERPDPEGARDAFDELARGALDSGPELSELASRMLARQRTEAEGRAQRLLAAAPEPRGQELLLLSTLGISGTTTSFLAAIRAEGATELVVARRLLDHLAEDEELVEIYLSPLIVEHPSLNQVCEVVLGSDGGVFRIERWRPGVSLAWLRAQGYGQRFSLRALAELGRDLSAGLSALASAAPGGAHRAIDDQTTALTFAGEGLLSGGPEASTRSAPTRREITSLIDDGPAAETGPAPAAAGPWRTLRGRPSAPSARPTSGRGLVSRLRFWKR